MARKSADDLYREGRSFLRGGQPLRASRHSTTHPRATR